MSVPMGGYYQTAPEVSMDWISKAWALFTQKVGVWISAMLILFVIGIGLWLVIAIPTGMLSMMLSIFQTGSRGGASTSPFVQPTFGISYYVLVFLVSGVAWILMGGVFRMALRNVRGEEVAIGDIFQISDVAVSLFVSGLITSFVCTIGFYLCILPGFIGYGVLMFTPLIIVDQKIGPIDALKQSFEMLKSQWLMAAVFYFVASLVASLGGFACVVGALATYPLLFLAIAYGYNLFVQPFKPAPGYGAAQPGVWPPPPSASNALPYGQTGAGPQTGQPGAWPPQQPSQWPPAPPSAPPPGQWPPQQSAPPTGQWPPQQPSAPPAADWPAQSPPPPYGQTPPEDPNRPLGGS